MRGGLRAAVLAATLGLGAFQAMPDLGQQRALSSRPGSGLVKRSGGRSPRRDGARQAAAQAKRERKNAKRGRHWYQCWLVNPCRTTAPYALNWGRHGK